MKLHACIHCTLCMRSILYKKFCRKCRFMSSSNRANSKRKPVPRDEAFCTPCCYVHVETVTHKNHVVSMGRAYAYGASARKHPHAQEIVAGHRTSSKARGKVGCSLTYLYQQSGRIDVQGEWKCCHCCVKLSCSCQLALLKYRGVTNPNNRLKVHSIVTPTCAGGFPTDSVLESMHCSYCQLWHCTCMYLF